MADPFEVRMRFTSQLQHLNASVSSALKAANYALKYKDMDEDLHSCILEQVERVSAAKLGPFLRRRKLMWVTRTI
jgi:CTD kinase subunit gamma